MQQIIGDNSDKSWEQLGRTDPYYGVLTQDKFRRGKLDPEARKEFFSSGSVHMVSLLRRVETLLGPVTRGKALDFGCGVGRLALPLSAECGFAKVTGMDISESMLNEARRNALDADAGNIDFVLSDDLLSRLEGNYDFVHTFIVLQHIPVARGEVIVRQLIARLAPGGVAALQMPFARKVGALRTLAGHLAVRVRPLYMLANLFQGRPWNEPPMQMNRYNMNSLFELLFECGISQATAEFLREGGNVGAYLLIRKSK